MAEISTLLCLQLLHQPTIALSFRILQILLSLECRHKEISPHPTREAATALRSITAPKAMGSDGVIGCDLVSLPLLRLRYISHIGNIGLDSLIGLIYTCE